MTDHEFEKEPSALDEKPIESELIEPVLQPPAPDASEPVLETPEEIPPIPAMPETEAVDEPVEEAPKSEGKVRRFFRNLLRWTLGLLIVFGLGFITAIFTLYQPSVAELRAAVQAKESELLQASQDAQTQIAELEEQVAEYRPLGTENENLLSENEQLRQQQSETDLHIAILNARVDVASARLALIGDDPARAQVALDQTADTLVEIEALLPPEQSGMVTALEQRLAFVLDEIEEDVYAAQSDLDVLGKSLLELEDALFGK